MPQSCGTWYPTIFPDKCDGCTSFGKPRCAEYCPNEVFKIQNGKAYVAYPHKCVNGCTACEPLCPKRAIIFPRREAYLGLSNSKDKGMLRKTTCSSCGKNFWTNREADICMNCEKPK